MIALPDIVTPADMGLLGADGRAVLAGVDHPLVTGPVADLALLPGTIAAARAARPDAVLLHRGPLAAGLWRRHPEVRLVVHLSASSDLSAVGARAEALACTLDEAARLGADAVSASFSAGSLLNGTRRALAVLDRLARDCARRRLPLLVVLNGGTGDPERWRRAAVVARTAERLGAHAIRIGHPGREDWIAWFLDRCDAPVLLAVGVSERAAVLELAEMAVTIGAAGVALCLGARGATGAEALVRAVAAVVHGDRTGAPALARSA